MAAAAAVAAAAWEYCVELITVFAIIAGVLCGGKLLFNTAADHSEVLVFQYEYHVL